MAKKKGGSEKNHNKEFLWVSLRASFYLMIVLFVFFTLIRNTSLFTGYFGFILDMLFFISIFFTFVASILHLNDYKEKRLAIIALIVSTLLLLGLSLYITTILIRNIYYV